MAAVWHSIDEILVLVVRELPFLDIVRAREVCWAWKRAIEGSKLLLYLVELGINDMVDETDSTLPLHRLLDDLRNAEDGWRRMTFVQSSTLNLAANGSPELCGDVVTMLHWVLDVRSPYASFAHFAIPKPLTKDPQASQNDSLDEPVTRTDLRGELVRFSTYIWDMEYDVLILLYGDTQHLSILSLSTASDHPSATQPSLKLHGYITGNSVLLRVSHQHVAIVTHEYEDTYTQLYIIDWKAGVTVSSLRWRDRDPASWNDRFMFLPDDRFAVLLPSYVFRARGGKFSLEIFSFSTSRATNLEGPTECCHLASFSLPFAELGQPMLIHPDRSLGAPTTLNFSTLGCIVAISWIDIDYDVTRLLVTHVRSLLADGDSHAPSKLPKKHTLEEWSKHYSLIPVTRDTRPHVTIVGARLIMSDPANSLGTHLFVYDFNQRRCRYFKSAEFQPVSWPARPQQPSVILCAHGNVFGETRGTSVDKLLFTLTKWEAERILTDRRSGIFANNSVLMLVEYGDWNSEIRRPTRCTIFTPQNRASE